MRNLSFALLLSVLTVLVSAQTPRQIIDSLKLELEKNPSRAEKAKILGDLCWYYNSVELDSSVYYGNQALELAEQLEDRSLISQTLSDLGAVHFVLGDIDESVGLLERSLEIRKEDNDEEGIASIEFKLGNNFFKKSDFSTAMEYYITALDYYEKAGNQPVAAVLNSNIGNTYYSLKNYPKSLEYLEKAKDYLSKNDLKQELANTLVSMGNVYNSMRQRRKALAIYDEAVAAAAESKNFIAKAAAYNNIGGVYYQMGQNEEALSYIHKGLEIRENHGLETEAASSLVSLAEIYNHIGDYRVAKNLLYRSLNIFSDYGINEKLGHIYFHLTKAFIGLGEKDSADTYMDQYSYFQEKNFNEDVLKITGELETKYQTNKKEKLILEQKVSLAEQQLTIMKKNRWITIFLGLILLSALGAYTIYHFQKLKNDRLKRENELKDALIRIEAQNKVQEERLRISRDLHDNIGSQLTFIISSLDNLKFRAGDQNPDFSRRLEGIAHFTRTTITELRGTIWAMNKGSISFEDLKIRLDDFCNNAKAAAPDIRFKVMLGEGIDDEDVFTAYEGINIYRIVQEAINNAIKHSNCSEIQVTFEKTPKGYEARVRDNGSGIDMEKLEEGNGLANMRKRAEDLGGSIDFRSLPEGGTEVHIII